MGGGGGGVIVVKQLSISDCSHIWHVARAHTHWLILRLGFRIGFGLGLP